MVDSLYAHLIIQYDKPELFNLVSDEDPASQEDRKVLLLLLGRMNWGLSHEGVDAKRTSRALLSFQEAEKLQPTLSSTENGLGLVAAAGIESAGTGEQSLAALEKAMGHYERALLLATSPLAAARVKNNVADAIVRAVVARGLPALRLKPLVAVSNLSPEDLTDSGSAVCERDPRSCLTLGRRYLSTAIQADGGDGTYYATRGQVGALIALGEEATAAAGSRAARDQQTDILNGVIDDLREADRMHIPLVRYFGTPADRKRFGLELFDLPDKTVWLSRLKSTWGDRS
jgi:hypothetical protein